MYLLKKISLILSFAAIVILMASCSTTEKFTVYAPAGTKIYTPNATAQPALTITSDKEKITVPSDMYCGYLLVDDPQTGLKVPVGVDYKTSKHYGAKFALYTGYGLASAGLGASFGSLIALVGMAASDEDDELVSQFGLIAAAGAGVAGIGAGIGIPAQYRLKQTAYDYNFGYVSKQQIDMPVLATSLRNPNPPKSSVNINETSTQKSGHKKATSGKDTSNKSKSNGSQVSSSRTDVAQKIVGTYDGTGKLLLGKKVDENYDDVTVVIERVDRTHVSVSIIESGEDYFESPIVYKVTSNKKGGYSLVVENLPAATIEITKRGVLTFKHKEVNIDGEIYSLEIEGKLQND